MPQFEIVLKSPALGEIVRERFANFAEDALDDFLAQMETAGVKRTSETTATFLDEVEIEVRPVKVDASVAAFVLTASALAQPGREWWRR